MRTQICTGEQISAHNLTSSCLLYILTGLGSPRRLCNFALLDSLKSPGLICLNSWLYRFAPKLWSCHQRQSREVCCGFFNRLDKGCLCGVGYWHSAWPLRLTFDSLYVILLLMRRKSISSHPQISVFFPVRAAIFALCWLKIMDHSQLFGSLQSQGTL